MKLKSVVTTFLLGVPACASEGDVFDASSELTTFLSEGDAAASSFKQAAASFDDWPEDPESARTTSAQAAIASTTTSLSPLDELNKLIDTGDGADQAPAEKEVRKQQPAAVTTTAPAAQDQVDPAVKIPTASLSSNRDTAVAAASSATSSDAVATLNAELDAKDKELKEQRERADKLESEVEALRRSKAAEATPKSSQEQTPAQDQGEVASLKLQLQREVAQEQKLKAALTKIRAVVVEADDPAEAAAVPAQPAVAPAASVEVPTVSHKKLPASSAPAAKKAATLPRKETPPVPHKEEVVPSATAALAHGKVREHAAKVSPAVQPAKATKVKLARAQPAKKHPVKTRLAKAEPAKVEPVKAAPKKSAPVKAHEKAWAALPADTLKNHDDATQAVETPRLRGQAATAVVAAKKQQPKAVEKAVVTTPAPAENDMPMKADPDSSQSLSSDGDDDAGFASLEKKLAAEENRISGELDNQESESSDDSSADTEPLFGNLPGAPAVQQVTTSAPTAALTTATPVKVGKAEPTSSAPPASAESTDFKALETKLKEEDEKISELDGESDEDSTALSSEASEESSNNGGKAVPTSGGDLSNVTLALGKEAEGDAAFLAQFERSAIS